MSEELSPTMREYLAEIYRLSEGNTAETHEVSEDGFVSTSALADMLDVSAPAVNRMVTRLKELDLLEHEPYRGIRLTNAGQREALKELRRHRIAEVFLVKVMGFGWHEVHEEAHNMASSIGEIIAERMLQMSEYPAFCPHGEPIPAPDGTLPAADDFLLSGAKQGKNFTITRIRTREPERLEYLAALGLTPGTEIHLLHAAPFNGPMQLRVGKEYRIIGHNLAELIRVKN